MTPSLKIQQRFQNVFTFSIHNTDQNVQLYYLSFQKIIFQSGEDVCCGDAVSGLLVYTWTPENCRKYRSENWWDCMSSLNLFRHQNLVFVHSISIASICTWRQVIKFKWKKRMKSHRFSMFINGKDNFTGMVVSDWDWLSYLIQMTTSPGGVWFGFWQLQLRLQNHVS